MSAADFKDLTTHIGHKIVVVTYGRPTQNVAIECETCAEVLIDFDKNEPQKKFKENNAKEKGHP